MLGWSGIVITTRFLELYSYYHIHMHTLSFSADLSRIWWISVVCVLLCFGVLPGLRSRSVCLSFLAGLMSSLYTALFRSSVPAGRLWRSGMLCKLGASPATGASPALVTCTWWYHTTCIHVVVYVEMQYHPGDSSWSALLLTPSVLKWQRDAVAVVVA